MSPATASPQLDDVLRVLVHQWTYCGANASGTGPSSLGGCPPPVDLGSLMLASKSVRACVLQPTGLSDLVAASMDCNASRLVECMRRGGMDASQVRTTLSESYVSASGLVRAVRAIEHAARWNALQTMREHGVLDVGAAEWWEGGRRVRVSLDDDVFRELARSMLHGALWRKRWRKEVKCINNSTKSTTAGAGSTSIDSSSIRAKVLNTNIMLTTLLTMASEIYTTATATLAPSAILPGTHTYAQNIDKTDAREFDTSVRKCMRHVDFRMHATHAFFSFVGASFSNAFLDYGRAFGIELVRTLQGQLIESWRVKWNEGNRRMHRRVSTLLDHVYDVLARPYGPPPILVLTLMFIDEHGNEEDNDIHYDDDNYWP